MNWRRSEINPERSDSLPKRARRDLIAIAIVVLIGCIAVLLDPNRTFEWIAQHRVVEIDEFLAAVVIIGTGFAVFSWRRWTDLSRQVAEYKRLQAALSAINSEASLLSETDDLLQSCLSPDEAYRIAIRHIEIQLPTFSGAIFAITQARETAEVVASWGQPALVQNVFPITDCWGLRRARVNISLASDPRVACAHIGSPAPRYAMCLPMMAQGEILGVLYLDSGSSTEGRARSANESLTESQERMVKTLAEHLALAVANLNMRETLRTQSIRDPLTGLFNRRYMEESLEREFHRSLRKGSSFAVLMIDIDHFKRINDLFGHEAGDAVLREMATLFQMQLRGEDIVSRYGGEEFLLILPETEIEAALEFAERLRQAALALQLNYHVQTLDSLSISIGLCCYPQHGATVEALVRHADAALYRAKEKGRDCVVAAETL